MFCVRVRQGQIKESTLLTCLLPPKSQVFNFLRCLSWKAGWPSNYGVVPVDPCRTLARIASLLMVTVAPWLQTLNSPFHSNPAYLSQLKI